MHEFIIEIVKSDEIYRKIWLFSIFLWDFFAAAFLE